MKVLMMFMLRVIVLLFVSAVMVLAPYLGATVWAGLTPNQGILCTWLWVFLFMCILAFTEEE